MKSKIFGKIKSGSVLSTSKLGMIFLVGLVLNGAKAMIREEEGLGGHQRQSASGQAALKIRRKGNNVYLEEESDAYPQENVSWLTFMGTDILEAVFLNGVAKTLCQYHHSSNNMKTLLEKAKPFDLKVLFSSSKNLESAAYSQSQDCIVLKKPAFLKNSETVNEAKILEIEFAEQNAVHGVIFELFNAVNPFFRDLPLFSLPHDADMGAFLTEAAEYYGTYTRFKKATDELSGLLDKKIKKEAYAYVLFDTHHMSFMECWRVQNVLPLDLPHTEHYRRRFLSHHQKYAQEVADLKSASKRERDRACCIGDIEAPVMRSIMLSEKYGKALPITYVRELPIYKKRRPFRWDLWETLVGAALSARSFNHAQTEAGLLDPKTQDQLLAVGRLDNPDLTFSPFVEPQAGVSGGAVTQRLPAHVLLFSLLPLLK